MAAASARAGAAARARTHRGREQGSRTRAWRGSARTCGRARRERASGRGVTPGTPGSSGAGEGGRARPLQIEPPQARCATSHRRGGRQDTQMDRDRPRSPPRIPHLRGIRSAAPECRKRGSVAAIKAGGAHEHCAGGTGGGWERSRVSPPYTSLPGRAVADQLRPPSPDGPRGEAAPLAPLPAAWGSLGEVRRSRWRPGTGGWGARSAPGDAPRDAQVVQGTGRGRWRVTVQREWTGPSAQSQRGAEPPNTGS